MNNTNFLNGFFLTASGIIMSLCLLSTEVKAQEKGIKGTIIKVLPSGYRVKLLENERVIYAHFTSRIRKAFVRIYVGDTVLIAINTDSTRGRIIYCGR